MKYTLIAAASVALTGVASANDYLLGGSDDLASVAASASTPATTEAFSVSNDLPPMLAKGTQEFGVAGSLNFADDFAYNLNLTYGWFVRDKWEIGFKANVQGIDDDVSFGLGLFTEYNFHNMERGCKWVPYVGFSASWAHLDSDAFDADSIALGLNFGVKYFIRENIAVSFSVGAEYAFDDVFPGEDDFQPQIDIGTRFYF